MSQAARALDALSRRDKWTSAAGRVFCDDHGRALNDGAIRASFYDALEAAEIDRDRGTGKPLVLHDLRHTFDTLAVQAFPLTDVKASMGRADIQATMIYVHHTPQHAAADRLGQLVAEHDSPARPDLASAQ